MPLGRLDSASSEQALKEPLERGGFSVDDSNPDWRDALAKTDDYPYFVQLIGSAIWKSASDLGRSEIDSEVMAVADCSFQDGKNNMYFLRERELDKDSMFEEAMAVARLFNADARGYISKNEIIECIAGTSTENIQRTPESIFDKLIEQGFLWETRGRPLLFQPGIPSLMNHIIESHNMLREHGSEKT